MMSAARFRWNVARNIFPLSSLPCDIVLLICNFLSHKDKANLSRVNQHFRQIFRSPQPWKEVTASLKSAKIKQCLPFWEVLAARKIKYLELTVLDAEALVRTVFKYLPHLEGLLLPRTTNQTVHILQECVPNECNLKKLHLGEILLSGKGRWRRESCSSLAQLFTKLKSLEDVAFGPIHFNPIKPDSWQSSGNCASSQQWFDWQNDIKCALCTSGNLKSLTINYCDLIDVSWMKEILVKNQQVHTLRLRHARQIIGDCSPNSIGDQGVDALRATFLPQLRTLDLTGSLSTNWFFSWFSQCADKISGITSVNFSNCENTLTLNCLSKLTDVEELDLTQSQVSNSMLKKLHLTHLKSLELQACHKINGEGIICLSASVGSSLLYLGLKNCPNISSYHLMMIPTLFPELRSLDLSCCNVTDEILKEWYLNSSTSGQPRLRKLNLKGCEEVTQTTIDSVCLKTRNRLIVEQ